ncbi:hypothetical protein C8R44DRAFT_729666 [Mycena epipterygia]|nr:hypothetical protein C8R44DRAFT_729666 [Mycena epipterygia]
MPSLDPTTLSKSEQDAIRLLHKTVRATRYDDPIDQDAFLVASAHSVRANSTRLRAEEGAAARAERREALQYAKKKRAPSPDEDTVSIPSNDEEESFHNPKLAIGSTVEPLSPVNGKKRTTSPRTKHVKVTDDTAEKENQCDGVAVTSQVVDVALDSESETTSKCWTVADKTKFFMFLLGQDGEGNKRFEQHKKNPGHIR